MSFHVFLSNFKLVGSKFKAFIKSLKKQYVLFLMFNCLAVIFIIANIQCLI